MKALRMDRTPIIAAFLGVIVSIITLRLVNPGDVAWFPSCPFYALTGLYCPGCGSLRALHQLLHFRLCSALALNPLTVISLPFLAIALGSHATRRQHHNRSSADPLWGWLCFWVILLFWISRNIPMRPFEWLGPSETEKVPEQCQEAVTMARKAYGAPV